MWVRNIITLIVGAYLISSCSTSPEVAPFVELNLAEQLNVDLFTKQEIRDIPTSFVVGVDQYKNTALTEQTVACSILNPNLITLSHKSIFISTVNTEAYTIEFRGCLDRGSIDNIASTDSIIKVGNYSYFPSGSSNISAVVEYTDPNGRFWSTELGANPDLISSFSISAVLTSDDSLSKNIIYGSLQCLAYDNNGNTVTIGLGEFKCRIRN